MYNIIYLDRNINLVLNTLNLSFIIIHNLTHLYQAIQFLKEFHKK